MRDETDRSAPQLMGDLVNRVTELFRKEMLLLRAELSEKSTEAATALGMIVGGAVIAIAALNVLAAALVVAIENLGVSAGLSALIVGVAFGALAFFLVSKGADELKVSRLAPERAARAASRDAEMLKEKI